MDSRPPNRETIRWIFEKFDATGSVKDLPKSGRPRSAHQMHMASDFFEYPPYGSTIRWLRNRNVSPLCRVKDPKPGRVLIRDTFLLQVRAEEEIIAGFQKHME